jgi:hypothetical protein
MNEREFRELEHQFGKYHANDFGSEVCEGYRPDLILLRRGYKLAYIIEFESTPSRKTIIGDLTKAEKFSEDEIRSVILVIVLRERSNTKKQQIISHLKPYFTWFKSRATKKAGLSDVFIITDKDYKASVSSGEVFGSPEFCERCLHVGCR